MAEQNLVVNMIAQTSQFSSGITKGIRDLNSFAGVTRQAGNATNFIGQQITRGGAQFASLGRHLSESKSSFAPFGGMMTSAGSKVAGMGVQLNQFGTGVRKMAPAVAGFARSTSAGLGVVRMHLGFIADGGRTVLGGLGSGLRTTAPLFLGLGTAARSGMGMVGQSLRNGLNAGGGGLLSGMGGIAKGLGGGIMGALGGVGGMLASPLGMLGVSLGAMAAGGAGVRIARDMEQAEVGFTTLLGSADQAKRMMSDLKGFAASTPFTFADLAPAANKMMALGFSARDVLPNLKTFGDAAAGLGLGSEGIGRITVALGQMKAKGTVQAGEMNQLAEVGIPAWEMLAKTLGTDVAGAMKQVESRSVSSAKAVPAIMAGMDKRFGGGMEAQSQTLGGLFSTLQDNASQALGGIAGMFIDAFGVKDAMKSLGDFTAAVPSMIGGMMPFVQQYANTMIAEFKMFANIGMQAFNGIGGAASSLFTWLTGASSPAWAQIQTGAIEFMAGAEWAFNNIGQVGELLWLKLRSGVATFIGETQHFFTGVLPSVFTWATSNFGDLFYTATDYVLTLMVNLGQNIRNIMGEVWDFLASGGTKELALTWEPLQKGFVSTLKSLPDIPPRAIGPVEQMLNDQTKAMESKVGGEMGDHIAKRMEEFNATKAGLEKPTALADFKATTPAFADDEDAPGKGKKGKGTHAIKQDALTRGSREAASAIARAMNNAAANPMKKSEELAKQQLDAQKRMVTLLERDKEPEYTIAPGPA